MHPTDPKPSPSAARRTGELPVPAPDEAAHSARLARLIRDDIAQSGGAIDFARYMDLALYTPGLGYYAGGAHKFGRGGDFVTAPELGSVFGRCLARQCAPILAALGGADILEAGAGSGALAAELLPTLAALGQPPRRYLILELSTELRDRQQRLIAERAPQLLSHVEWLDRPPDRFRGVVVANELLDAMPAQRFRIGDRGPMLLTVAADADGFVWRETAADPVLAALINERLGELAGATGYTSEINLRAEGWVGSLAERLDAGVMLLVDYGFPRAEFYHPQRAQGSLMCHYRQHAHADPLILAGLQDITTHIDFTAIAEAGHQAGLKVLGYTSQAAFLLGNGIAELGAPADDAAAQYALAQQIKRLTLPQEMGETFKVLALGRGVDLPLSGFALQDRRGRL